VTLGFGTAALGGGLSVRERRRVLETALELGVTYFDTAPLYGAGEAERALGRVAAGRRDSVRIATKTGIFASPRRSARLLGPLRRPVARIVRNRVPSRAVGGRFDPGSVRTGLEGSLARLGTDYVDVLLLHEIRAEALSEELLAELELLVQDGKVRRAGIATGQGPTAEILARGGAFPEVVQLAYDSLLPAPRRTLVVHSVLAGGAHQSPGARLVEAARTLGDGIVLFGSRNPRHVRETIEQYRASLG
jgi:aryl-alcohol dehydrogenase-like predicted oxidoreductase